MSCWVSPGIRGRGRWSSAAEEVVDYADDWCAYELYYHSEHQQPATVTSDITNICCNVSMLFCMLVYGNVCYIWYNYMLANYCAEVVVLMSSDKL